MFGPEDQFFNRFAGLARLSPALPLIGGATRFQPVYVDDVAQAIFAAASDPSAAGRVYELGGPRIYTFRELMELMLKTIHRRRLLVPAPFFAARIKAAAFDLIPYLTFGMMRNDILTVDQVRMLASDNVVGADVGALADLGVTPTTVEAVIPSYLYRFRPHGQYDDDLLAAG